MFKSIKSKLSSMKSDVTDGIRKVKLLTELTSTDDSNKQQKADVGSSDITSEKSLNHTEHVLIGSKEDSEEENNDALQDLLHSYELSWKEMASATRSNIAKSKAASVTAAEIQKSVSLSSKAVTSLENEILEFPTTSAEIRNLSSQIATIHSQCTEIEDALVLLLNVSENVDTEKSITRELQQKIDLENKRRKDHETLIANRLNAQRQKAFAAELKEANFQRQQLAKELFYKSAFEEDMERYRIQQRQRKT